MTVPKRAVVALLSLTLLGVGVTVAIAAMSGALPWWAISTAGGVVFFSCLAGGVAAIRRARQRAND